MTVSSLTTKNSYSGNGSTSAFSYTFKIFDDDDVTVIIRTDSTGTETVKTKTTHYTVSGVGSASGGTITFTSGNIPASGETVLLLRNTPLTQATDYTPNDPFPAATHEDALDKLTLISQDTQEEIDRSIKLSRANTMTSTEFTVPAATRANKIFGFDASGELTVTQELGTFKGDWAASTSYVARDLVRDTSTTSIFIVNEAHTSSGSLPLTTNTNSSKYTLILESAFSGVTAGTVSASKGVLVDSNKDITGFRNVTLSGDLTLGSGAVINEAELEAIDGVTAGTVAASKAVVVDSNKDAASFRNITLTGELDAGSLDVSGDADIDGTLEADAITLNGTAITATATLDTGISNNNVPKFTSGVADNDFLRVDGTAIEGRSASEVLSDISAAPAAGSSNIVTTGALDSGSITSGFGTIDTGSSNITTTGLGTFGSVNIDGGAVDGVTIGTNSAVTDLRVDNLKLDGNTISSTNSNGAVTIDPNGTGNVALGNFTFDADQSVGAGQDNYVLKYDNSAGTIQLEAETSGGLSDIVNDSSPQLGGNLDLNSNNITGTGNISTTGTATFATADNNPQLTLKSTDADGSVGPMFDLKRDSGSPADSDTLGRIRFLFNNDAAEEVEGVRLNSILADASDGTEDATFVIKHMVGGTLQDSMRFTGTETVINEGGIDLDFRVESNSNANMLFVDAGNDRVGIGTNSPASGTTLDVSGNGGGGAVVSRIRNIGGAAGDDATLELSIATASEEMRILFTDSSGTAGQIVVDGGDNSMAFETGTSEAMRIDSSGDVLIGTTSFTSGGGGIKLGATTASREFSADNTGARQQIGFHNPNGEVGSIFTSGSATTFSTSSDYRLKENVVALSNAITRVKTLAPKRFNFIADANTTFDGFLAHEAQAVVPEAVIGTHNEVETWTQQQIDDGDAPDGTSAGDNKLDEDDNTIPVMQGIDHSKLVPLLTGALQEAIAKIETLETKVAALEAGS